MKPVATKFRRFDSIAVQNVAQIGKHFKLIQAESGTSPQRARRSRAVAVFHEPPFAATELFGNT